MGNQIAQKKQNHISAWSVICLLTSILGFALYSVVLGPLKSTFTLLLWITVSVLSIIQPPIVKWIRLKGSDKGRGFEIASIIIGGFDFYFVVFAYTKWPVVIAYLGWLISGIAYSLVKEKPEAHNEHTPTTLCKESDKKQNTASRQASTELYTSTQENNSKGCTNSNDDIGHDVLKLLLMQRGAEETISAENAGEHLKNLDNPQLGLTPEKPIYTKGIYEQEEYIKSLVLPDGSPIQWQRRGSISPRGVKGLVDIYDIADSQGHPYTTIYINMYGDGSTPQAPRGFQFKGSINQKAEKKHRKKSSAYTRMKVLFLITLALLLVSLEFNYLQFRDYRELQSFVTDIEQSVPTQPMNSHDVVTQDEMDYQVAVHTISITPDDYESEDSWNDAYNTAYTVYLEWLAGPKTETSMVEIMDRYGPSQGGGQVYTVSQGEFVSEIDRWCFDSSREQGDASVIKNPYGYSICYFIERVYN